jgi:enterochelin esterase-like enzyme
VAATFAFAAALLAPAAHAESVSIEAIEVHGASLEGNLEGDSATRSVLVLLPPSYASAPTRHYPVIYGLHGFLANNRIWASQIGAPGSVGAAFAAGAGEMIIVLPSAETRLGGSMFSSSVTTGDWESFVADELVAYIDAHYRTLARRESRGLVGHSMGGYGTARIGMKRADVFGALYIMSPCCFSPVPKPASLARLQALRSPEDIALLSFSERRILAGAAAWSPNPNRAPFYLDLPGGDDEARVLAQWAANTPLAMAAQYMFNLRRYRAIAIDVGDQDPRRTDAARFYDMLRESGVEASFEIYEGDHMNRLAERFEGYVIPFFARTLAFEEEADDAGE